MPDGTETTTPTFPEFTTTIGDLVNSIGDVTSFFLNTFVGIADMLFSSPFVLFIGLSVIIGILGVAASYLRIRRGGRRRR